MELNPKFDLSIFDEKLNIIREFIKKMEVVGGNAIEITDNKKLTPYITKAFPVTKINFSTLKDETSFNTIDLEKLNKPHELKDLDVLV